MMTEPKREETLQYITYSAKELLVQLNEKVDGLDTKLDGLTVEYARLPAVFVTQQQFRDVQRDATTTRRFAISAVIAAIGAFGTFVGIAVNALL